MATSPPTHYTNIKKWILGLICGSCANVSFYCFCCGCMDKIKAPSVLYGDEDIMYKNALKKEKEIVHILNWYGLAEMACKCIPLCCGCCFGCCGTISPIEGVTMTAKKDR